MTVLLTVFEIVQRCYVAPRASLRRGAAGLALADGQRRTDDQVFASPAKQAGAPGPHFRDVEAASGVRDALRPPLRTVERHRRARHRLPVPQDLADDVPALRGRLDGLA